MLAVIFINLVLMYTSSDAKESNPYLIVVFLLLLLGFPVCFGVGLPYVLK